MRQKRKIPLRRNQPKWMQALPMWAVKHLFEAAFEGPPTLRGLRRQAEFMTGQARPCMDCLLICRKLNLMKGD